jgi:hypothetical protein
MESNQEEAKAKRESSGEPTSSEDENSYTDYESEED